MSVLMTIMSIIVMSFYPLNDIESSVIRHNLVEQAECIAYSDTIVVALKTQPIFFRSDRDELVDSIKDNLISKYNIDDVIVSFDKDIYYKITKIDEQRLKGVKEEELNPSIEELVNTARERDRV